MAEPRESQLDDAIARRLARLNAMPVDSSRVDAFLRQRIPPEPAASSRRRWFLRPMNAIAASLVGAVLIGVLIVSLGDRPAVAAPAQIAQWHAQMTSGADGKDIMSATDLQSANQMLAKCDPKAPDVPGMDGQMACCCVRRVGQSRISCVMVNQPGGESVMVCVGDGSKIKIPPGDSTVDQGGVRYHLMSQGGVNIVMSYRDGRWIACTGKVPHSALIETAAGLKF